MRVYFNVNDAIGEIVTILQEELAYEIADNEADAELVVNATEADGNFLKIDYKDSEAEITYAGGNSRFSRALGLLFEAIAEGKTEFSKEETPKFEKNGSMIDMSRNSPMKLSVIKQVLRKLSLMGMNVFMLYTEEMYELDGEPYFGHMRGRYSKSELIEVDRYALKLGIEVVPCIQCLGHMEMFLKGVSASKYKDTANVLLAGSEDTYDLIARMLKTASEIFTTRRVHIGFDEAYNMGTGSYLRKFGYRNQEELFYEHLNRVVDIVHSIGLHPIMWSDMFFATADPQERYYVPDIEFSEDVKKLVPDELDLVYWDYDHNDYDMYDGMINKHRELSGNRVIFAGGIWTWVGFTPYYTLIKNHTEKALRACMDNGVKEVLATVWQDMPVSMLATGFAGVQMFAEMDYSGKYDEESFKKRFRFIWGAEAEDFWVMENASMPHQAESREIASMPLAFNDPLIGLLDWHVEDVDCREFYGKLVADYKERGNDGFFGPCFEMHKKLLSYLELKADYGVRLKKAYDADDRDELKKLADDALELVSRCRVLRDAHRDAWMCYNKPFGYEVIDAYYGAMCNRLETTNYRVMQYLDGEIDAIEELGEDRLKFDCTDYGEGRDRVMYYNSGFVRYLTNCRF